MVKNILLLVLIASGLFVRIPGLFHYGNHNYDTYREWGFQTRNFGLGYSFAGGYGPFAYLIMGLADYIGSFTPPIWWWPYKAANVFFEFLILFLLYKIFPKKKLIITFLYWLNPWFLIPSAYEGFWDSAFGFFMLITAFYFDGMLFTKKINYFIAGFIFSITALIKPQIIAPVTILGIIFFINFIMKKRFKEIILFTGGAGFLPLVFSLFFHISQRGYLFMFKKYSDFLYYMPFLVNSEVNIWHSVTRLIMNINHMEGPIYTLSTKVFPYNLMEKGAQILYLVLIIIFVLKRSIKKTKYYYTQAFTFAFILMPQILTRSHAYHFYPATLLLTPLILVFKDKKLIILWIISILVHFYNIYWEYGLGDTIGAVFRPPGEPYISFAGIIALITTLGFIKYFLDPKKD